MIDVHGTVEDLGVGVTIGPETSLHPDLLPALARLIGAASTPTQLWVVSHSSRLIAAMEQSGQYRLEDLNAQLPSTNVEFANPRQSSIAVRGRANLQIGFSGVDGENSEHRGGRGTFQREVSEIRERPQR